MKRFLWAVILSMLLLIFGSETAFAGSLSSNPGISHSDVRKAYEEILSSWRQTKDSDEALHSYDFEATAAYYIFDIDSCGVAEMIVRYAAPLCDGDARYYVYKYNNGSASQIGELWATHCSTVTDGNALYACDLGGGGRFSVQDGIATLVPVDGLKRDIAEGIPAGYKDAEAFDFDDYSGLGDEVGNTEVVVPQKEPLNIVSAELVNVDGVDCITVTFDHELSLNPNWAQDGSRSIRVKTLSDNKNVVTVNSSKQNGLDYYIYQKVLTIYLKRAEVISDRICLMIDEDLIYPKDGQHVAPFLGVYDANEIQFEYAPMKEAMSSYDLQDLTVSFKDGKQGEHDYTFKWGMQYFEEDPTEFCPELGMASIWVSSNFSPKDDQIVKDAMEKLGFEYVDVTKSIDTNWDYFPVVACGVQTYVNPQKQLKTVLGVWVRGTNDASDVFNDLLDGSFAFTASGWHTFEVVKKYIEDNNLDTDNLIMYINGHSLGGATAQTLAMHIMGRGGYGICPKYVYTFASPRTEWSTDHKTDFSFMHTVINSDDPVPKVAPWNHHVGNNYYFTFHHGAMMDNHLCVTTYLPYMVTKYPDRIVCSDELPYKESTLKFETRFNKKCVIKVACPVDISVYDTALNQLAYTEGQAVCNDDIESGAIVLTNGDEKYIVINDYDKYFVAFEGTGDGVMEYTVSVLTQDDQLIAEKSYQNVPLEEGTLYSSSIDMGALENLEKDECEDTLDQLILVENNADGDVIGYVDEDGSIHKVSISSPTGSAAKWIVIGCIVVGVALVGLSILLLLRNRRRR